MSKSFVVLVLLSLGSLLLAGCDGECVDPTCDSSIPITADEAETLPQVISGWTPDSQAARYPEMARRAGIEGIVQVRFVVTADGRADRLNVIGGIGGGCDEAAAHLLREAEYQPGTYNGRPATVSGEARVTFELDDLSVTPAWANR